MSASSTHTDLTFTGNYIHCAEVSSLILHRKSESTPRKTVVSRSQSDWVLRIQRKGRLLREKISLTNCVILSIGWNGDSSLNTGYKRSIQFHLSSFQPSQEEDRLSFCPVAKTKPGLRNIYQSCVKTFPGPVFLLAAVPGSLPYFTARLSEARRQTHSVAMGKREGFHRQLVEAVEKRTSRAVVVTFSAEWNHLGLL